MSESIGGVHFARHYTDKAQEVVSERDQQLAIDAYVRGGFTVDEAKKLITKEPTTEELALAEVLFLSGSPFGRFQALRQSHQDQFVRQARSAVRFCRVFGEESK